VGANKHCNHISSGKEDWIWVPISELHGKDIMSHPWCVNCGVIKNISDDRAHKLGYWINIFSRLANHFSLTQVQKRIIAKELASNKIFNDIYSITESSQKEYFKNIIAKYCKINKNIIESFIC
jgi:hypothetical protein